MLIGSGISISQDGLLTFEEDIFFPEPDQYYLENILNVLYQRPDTFENHLLYYTYLGVYREPHLNLFQEMQLRFDITAVLPGLIMSEFNKTPGHFLSSKPNSNETYSEFLEVLWGEGLFILQKNNRSGEPEEVKAITAKKGDKVYIPPGYGSVTINEGEELLVVSSLVNAKANFLYEPFAIKKGAAYYYIFGESKKADFIRNEQYDQSASLELLGAPSVSLPIEGLRENNLYQYFTENPKSFILLK